MSRNGRLHEGFAVAYFLGATVTHTNEGLVAMRKSVATTAGLVAVLASFAFAPAAFAGNFYLYENTGYGGHVATFTGSDTELNNKYWDGTASFMQNRASSMKNYSSHAVGMWDIGNQDKPTVRCTGPSYTAQANSVDSSFANNNFNDKASCVIFL
jgi:hypothetical protein